MASRRTTTLPPAPPETAPPPGHEEPRRRARGLDRFAPYLFVAPLLAVFAAFYLWPALSDVLSSFFRWGLLRPWSPVEPDRWRFVGLANYTETLTDASFWNAVLNTAIWLVVFPLLVVGFSLLVSILVWYTNRAGAVFRTVFILPMTISLAAAGVIWSLVYNVDPQVGVVNAVLDRLGILGADWRLGPVELHPGAWLSNPGVLHLGFADIRLANLALVVPAFCRPLVVVGVVSVIFALRTFDIVYVMTGGGPAQDTMVLALLLWQQAFAFLDTPQGGQATAIAVLMSAVLVAGSFPYLRQLIAGRSR